jgi:hypothetical protein
LDPINWDRYQLRILPILHILAQLSYSLKVGITKNLMYPGIDDVFQSSQFTEYQRMAPPILKQQNDSTGQE